MAGSITLALRTAQSGLLTNQSALDTVANNIANVNSDNYSRKIASMEQRVAAGVGAGVQIAEVIRRVDEGLLKSLRREMASFEKLDVQTDYYERVQELFGTPESNSSLSHLISEFAESIESLSTNPDKTLEQNEAVNNAKILTTRLQDISASIQDLRAQADKEIEDDVNRINTIAQQIQDLNDKIVRNSSSNLDTTDLQDQRDGFLDEMSQILDIVYFRSADGDIIVFSGGGKTLVDNVPPTVSHAAAGIITAQATHASGDLGAIYVGDKIAGNDITNDIRDGKLKGLIELRDTVLTNLQAQIDEAAAEIRDAFNQVHNRGIPHPGLQSMDGTRRFLSTTTETIHLDATADVRFTMFDNNGDMLRTSAGVEATDTLRNIMVGAGGDLHGPWTLANIATNLQTWFRNMGATGATASFGTDGTLDIAMNTTTMNLAIRDEVDNGVSYPIDAGETITLNTGGGAGADTMVSSVAGRFSHFAAGHRITLTGSTGGAVDATYTVAAVSADGTTVTFTEDMTNSGVLANQVVNLKAIPTPKGATHQDATIYWNKDSSVSTGTADSITYSTTNFPAGAIFAAAGDTITLPVGADMDQYPVGSQFSVSGLTGGNAANNGTYTVGAVDFATRTITVTNPPEDITVDIAGPAGASTVISRGADEAVQGFSNFFGLNDFFVDGTTEALHESDVVATTFSTTASTLMFWDTTSTTSHANVTVNNANPDTLTAAAGTFSGYSAGMYISISGSATAANNKTYTITAAAADGSSITVSAVPSDNNTANNAFVATAAGTISITRSLAGSPLSVSAGLSLSDLATSISNTVSGVTASVVPDGDGNRIRIVNDGGNSMFVTDAAGDTLLNDIGLHTGDVSVATSIGIRSDMINTPSMISRGAVLWDAELGPTGEYYSSAADDTIALAMARAMSDNNQFDKAGGIAAFNMSFEDYAANIVSYNAALSNVQEDTLDYQRSLKESLEFKSNSVKGVNLDEEMSQLILLEQAYSASARVISIIQSMFDVLDRVIQ